LMARGGKRRLSRVTLSGTCNCRMFSVRWNLELALGRYVFRLCQPRMGEHAGQ
jgi:hypothetical protein